MNILLLDIDYTLLIPKNVYVYYTENGVEKKMDCIEFSNLNLNESNKSKYDLRDFREEMPLRLSIETSEPLEINLKIVESYLKEGWILGVLTARGCENMIAEVIVKWLKENLTIPFKINRENIYAVNDEEKKYKGDGSSQKKLLVLKDLVSKNIFNKIAFIDDNSNTLEIIENFNKTLKKDKKIKLILSNY